MKLDRCYVVGCGCPCDKFGSSAIFDEHVGKCVDPDDYVQCGECYEDVKWKNLKACIEKDKEYVICDICYVRVKEPNLERHKQKHIENETLYKCHLCKVSLKEKNFKIHKLKHKEDKVWVSPDHGIIKDTGRYFLQKHACRHAQRCRICNFWVCGDDEGRMVAWSGKFTCYECIPRDAYF